MKLPYAGRRVSERGKGGRRKGGRSGKKDLIKKREEGGGGEESAVVSLPPCASLSLDPSGVGGRERDSSHIRQRTKNALLLLQFVAEERRREQRHDDDRPRKKKDSFSGVAWERKIRFRDEIGEPKKAYGLGLLPARIFFCQPPPLPTFTLTYPGVASQKEETQETKSAFKPNRIAKQCLRKEKSFRTKVISKSVQKSPPKKANTSRYPPRHLQ